MCFIKAIDIKPKTQPQPVEINDTTDPRILYRLLTSKQTPPPHVTATAADGTHPTGMHSCSPVFPQ